MSRPRLFAELPAGLASVSLRLHGGANCRPPISRMGNKAGYAEVILAALNLRSGQGAERYLWAEADPDVAALLRCYPDADMLRRVAEIIRKWKDEEPRALWERLRAERKARGARDVSVDVAGTVIEHRWSFSQKGPSFGYGGPGTDPGDFAGRDESISCDATANACHRLAEYATIVSSNRLINMSGPALMNTGNGGTRFGAEFATPVEDVAGAFERVAREVAGWSFVAGGSMKGFGEGAFGGNLEGFTDNEHGHSKRPLVERLPDAMRSLSARSGWPPVRVTPIIPTAAELSEALGTPGDLDGVVVYMDPPYQGTTGYAHSLGRDEVVRHARAYAEFGATVAISEAEVVIPEWCAVEITAGRKGQKRTFSKQQAEWLTMNREPAHRVATQPALFAVGA